MKRLLTFYITMAATISAFCRTTGIFRAIRWLIGLLVAVILLGICAFIVAGRLGVFDGGCMIVDHVEVVDELRTDEQTLYLVYRITGFREKTEFYELYAARPSFDPCGQSKDMPLAWGDVFFPAEGMMVKDVLVRGTEIEIRYTRQTGKREAVRLVRE